MLCRDDKDDGGTGGKMELGECGRGEKEGVGAEASKESFCTEERMLVLGYC